MATKSKCWIATGIINNKNSNAILSVLSQLTRSMYMTNKSWSIKKETTHVHTITYCANRKAAASSVC